MIGAIEHAEPAEDAVREGSRVALRARDHATFAVFSRMDPNLLRGERQGERHGFRTEPVIDGWIDGREDRPESPGTGDSAGGGARVIGRAAHRTRHAVRRGPGHPATELTRTSHLQLADARRRRDALLTAARSLHAALERSCSGSECDPPCPFHSIEGAALTELAVRLAADEDGPAPVREPSAAISSFRAALADGVEAVRACRQTLHPVGQCWFSTEPGDDGCGEVLHLAHRLSD